MKVKKITSDEVLRIRGTASDSIIYYGAYVDGGQLAGVIGRRFRAWYATELCHLFVAPEHRSIGIAKALVAHALERVKTPLVVATVQLQNKESSSVFGKMGFRHISTVLNPNTGNTVMILLKEIRDKK